MEDIKQLAIDKCIRSGANPSESLTHMSSERKLKRRTLGTVRIVEIVNLPVQYVTNQATRIIVKAAGELAPDANAFLEGDSVAGDASSIESNDDVEGEKHASGPEDANESVNQIENYVPDIRDRQWHLSETDLGKFSCMTLSTLR